MKKITKSIFIISIIFLGIYSNGEMITANLSSITTNHPSSGNIDSIDRTGWWWTETEVISTESTDFSAKPLIAVDSEDNIHVIWEDWTDYNSSGSDFDIFYKRWDKITATWKTTEVISTESTGDSRSPSFFMDSEDNLHVVWHDYTTLDTEVDYDVFYKKRNATTSSWTTTEVISTESTAVSYKPAVIVDSVGNVHVVWEELTDDDGDGDRDIYYKKRDFGTGNWGTAEDISTVSDKNSAEPSLAIDSLDNVHLVWLDGADYLGAGASDMDVFYRSLDSATDSWSVTEVLSIVGSATKENPFIAVDSYDKIHISWADGADYLGAGASDYDIFYKCKPEAAVNWSSTELVSPLSDLASTRPCIAVDSSGFAYIVYEDDSDILEAGNDIDIFYNFKDPISGLWSITQLISSESTSNSYMAAITLGNGGMIHVVWYDYTNLDAEVDYDIFYKKLVGPPESPQLYPIVPNLNSSGSINIDWSDVADCDNYHLYRELSPITSLSNLTVLTSTANSFYTDTISENGLYYYVVVAENAYGQSDLSNMGYVQVVLEARLLPFVSNEGLVIVCILLGTQIILFVLGKVIKKKKEQK